MIRHDLPRFGPDAASAPGYIAELGEDRYRHVFGGSSWTIHERNSDGDPVLLLTLDLADPRLPEYQTSLPELPLPTAINSNVWEGRQVFALDGEHRIIRVIERGVPEPEPLPSELRFSVPLSPQSLRLRPMSAAELPVDEEAYWRACDEFVGGDAFIRVSGYPLWLQWVEEQVCACGQLAPYVAGVGYEQYDQPRGYLADRPFFIGEAALYFFFCGPCARVIVTSQVT